jgi:pre-rRNA-processing protein TSR4
MSVNEQSPSRVQLGFSLPLHCKDEYDSPESSSLLFDRQQNNIGHASPNWCDWDGGKIGGLPSWLNPRDIPDVLCCRGPCSSSSSNNNNSNDVEKGGTPLTFIAQLYCPADDVSNNPAAFHRSLYVFVCTKCCSDSSRLFEQKQVKERDVSECVRVLRCQLPKQNDFYPLIGDVKSNDGWEKHTSDYWSAAIKDDNLKLCVVCGQKSKGKCPKQGKWFCGPHHQKEYMRASNQFKKTYQKEVMPQKYLPSVYYESELVVEDEPEQLSTADRKLNDSDTINSKSLFPSKVLTDADANLEQSDLNELTGSTSLAEASTGVTDPMTLAFYARMNIGGEENDVRDQCLRYSRWPSTTTNDENSVKKQSKDDDDDEEEGPLWLSSDNRPDLSFPPPCQHCGAVRSFEFQILPQMIHYLLNDPEAIGKGNLSAESDRHVLTESQRAVLLEAKAKIESGVDLPEGFQEQHDLAVASARDALLGISHKDGDEGSPLGGEGAKDGLNWGTIAVYTCTASCGNSGSYLEEIAWMQPPLD